MSCLCCNLVGVNKLYSPISYTQSHGEKCKHHDITCGWLSNHPELHYLIPWTENLEGKLVLAPQSPTTPVDDLLSLTTLTKLQGELNKKLLEVKVAADRLAEYTKTLVAVPAVPVSTTNPAVATIAPPAAMPEVIVPSLRRGNRNKKLTNKAQAAVDALK